MYWMDLSGGDLTFYRDLLGWQPGDDGVFTVDGQVVAGHGATGGPGWNLHTVVDDVVAARAAAEQHGGSVVSTAPGSAVVIDPAGATFVIRDSGRKADLVNKPMAFSWAELCTPDFAGARSFYSAVFGWQLVDIVMEMPAGAVDYTVFLAGTAEAGGLMPAEGAFGTAPPPYWLAYVEAADADKLAAHTAELGGTVVVEPFDVPRIGRIALLGGRSGETFAVMQMP